MAKSTRRKRKQVEEVEQNVENIETSAEDIENIDLDEAVSEYETPATEPEPEPEPVKESEPTITVNEIDEKEKRAELILALEEKFSKQYFDKAKENGCDYASNGDWQKEYANMLNRISSFRGKHVLDIGGAFGSIAFSFFKQGAIEVICSDISKHCVDARKFPNVKMVKAPVQDMGVIKDKSIDIVHVSHVLNYLGSVDEISVAIKEIARVLKKGGVAFFVHSGLLSENFDELLKEHIGESLEIDYSKCDPKNIFFKNYKWDFHVVVKK